MQEALLRKFFERLIKEPGARKRVVQSLYKYCYNQKTAIVWKLKGLKKMLRRSNVKFS